MGPRGAAPAVEQPDRPADEDRRVAAHRARPLTRITILTWIAIAAVAALSVIAIVRASSGPAPLTAKDAQKTATAVVTKALEAQRNGPADASLAYRSIRPSLVVIRTGGAGGTADGSGTGADSGLGSGVIVDDRGAILTAEHVIAGSDRITVVFADGTTSAATVTRSEPENDIAVLATESLPEVLVPAVLGGRANVGDAVFAVGHPLGLTASLTAGVVSATDRSIGLSKDRTLEHLIQFDAAVNPGNSGGPLLDREGHVVGIVTALANPSKQSFFVGIGFAVPIGTAGGAAGAPAQ